MGLDANNTVRGWALERQGATRVFEKLGIDYCCGGGKSLTEACSSAKAPLDHVIALLEKAEQSPSGRESADWSKAPLAELVGHIVDKHHVYTRDEIARLQPLLAKVCSVHAQNHPELLRIQTVFGELSRELSLHMMKEEQVLFPYIVEMEQAINDRRPLPRAMFGTVQDPVRMMMLEHDSAGEALRLLSETSRRYVTPSDACISYRTLYQALEAFEADLHEHIHLENNILFPRAVSLESEAS